MGDKNPPMDWDVKTGKNILWSAALRVYAPVELHAELRSKLALEPALAARAGEKILDPAAPPGETFPVEPRDARLLIACAFLVCHLVTVERRSV